MEFASEYYFQLNYFKHLEKYSELSIKILNLSGARGPSSPEPTYTPSNELLALVLGAETRISRKNLKWQEKKLGKDHKISLGLRPRSDRFFNCYHIFDLISAKTIMKILKSYYSF